MQQLMSYMRSAMEHYQMIEDGDRIAVGVSGGKDSLALLVALCQMRTFYPIKYEIVAITLDPQFQNQPTDYSQIQELCDQLGITYIIRRTELYHVIFETRKEANPCSLCARMRRGSLHDAAKEAGCNKIALGHHMDDAAETFYMNLFSGGRAECFSPKSYLSRKDLWMIRPMIFAREKDVSHAANTLRLPVVESTCPIDGHTHRAQIRKKIQELEKEYGPVTEKTVNALQQAHLCGW